MSETKEQESCCAVAKALQPKRLAALDEELRTHGHRSFRKLAEAYGMPGQKSAIERHKHRCLRVGQGFEPPEAKDPPPRPTVRVDPVPRVPEVSQGQPPKVGTVPPHAPRARAPEPVKAATSLEERAAHVVSQLTAGTWDSARDIPRCAAAWGITEGSVRNEVRVIFAMRRLNRGDVEQREEESLGFYGWQLEDLQAALLDCVEPEEKVKVHARITEVRARMDAVAGIAQRSNGLNVNIYQSPQFIEATTRIVETFHGALDAAAVAAVLPDVDRLIVERVLDAVREIADGKIGSLAAPPVLDAAAE